MPGNSIFHAYDIRGIYPSEINEDEVYRICQAYAGVVKPKKVVLGRDVRESGPSLAAAASEGFRHAGVDILNIGVVPTDMFYYAVGSLSVDGGILISASHNPREWNGMNLCERQAIPISIDHLLPDIERQANARPLGQKIKVERTGTEEKVDVLPQYLGFLAGFIKKEIRPMKIAADANFSPQAEIFHSLIHATGIPITLVAINDRPDGSFPKGPPNPLLPERRQEITELVKQEKADLGVAWDGDGDRCFLVDERGIFQEGYFTTAVLAAEMLKMHPEAKILIDPRLTWATTETIKQNGGIPIVTQPGMTRMPKRARDENSPFGGELSSHFYFRDTFFRDSGILPILLILQMMSRDRRPLSSYYIPFESKYFISGELNYKIEDRESLVKKVEEKYKDGKVEYIDGLSVEYPEWRFNLRSSHTEPLLRLNIEAQRPELVQEKRQELEKIIHAQA